MGLKSKSKGNRIEREIVHRHRAAGIDAERVPLSGAAGGSYTGDLRIEGGLVVEVKARAGGDGFKTLERWLGDNDLLFLRRDRSDPLVVMPWSLYEQLMGCWPAMGRTGKEASGPIDLNELSLPELDDFLDIDALGCS
jgi:hypothetical protein